MEFLLYECILLRYIALLGEGDTISVGLLWRILDRFLLLSSMVLLPPAGLNLTRSSMDDLNERLFETILVESAPTPDFFIGDSLYVLITSWILLYGAGV